MAAPKPKKPRAEVTVEEGVKPVFALHKIIYGAGKSALLEVFTPVSEKERDELIDCGAARELTDAEQMVHSVVQSRKSTETPAPAPEGAQETSEAGDPDTPAPTDPDVIE